MSDKVTITGADCGFAGLCNKLSLLSGLIISHNSESVLHEDMNPTGGARETIGNSGPSQVRRGRDCLAPPVRWAVMCSWNMSRGAGNSHQSLIET